MNIRVHWKFPLDRSAKSVNPATPPSPPFNQCPPDGQDTSCGILIEITNSANNVYGDPSQGPFDGGDDTLIGLLNSSSDTISGIQLSSSTPAFGFDGDGLCTASPQPSGCPFGSTGYEGPGTSFSSITPDQTGGVVNFSPGIPPGQSAYFSLEQPLSTPIVNVGGPSTGEQGGPVNLSENPTTCSIAKPVNCATGTFWHQFTDFTVPGRGVALNYSRTYSSAQASVNGPLGYGWTDSYNMSLATDASGDVTVTQEDGSTVTFVPDGSGGFTAAPRVLATLTANPDGSFTFIRDRSQIQYNFSPAGQLTSEVDANGYVTQLSYNGSGQLTTVTDPAGRTLAFAYGGSNITSVTDPMGRKWSYSYDASGNLTSAADPLGRTWSFTYDANHQMLTMTDPRGGVTTNVYDSTGQVTSQTDPDGGTTTWNYAGDPASTGGGTTTMTDPNGNVTVYQYSNLELTSVTHAAGTPLAATTSYSYDPATLGVTSVTDPNGNVTTSSYDANGNLLSTTDPLGNTTSYSYNGFNEVLSKTTPLSETTSYSYDSAGNLLSVADPQGNTTTYAYADSAHPGDVTSLTNPDGNVTSYTYDSYGDVATVATAPSSTVSDTTGFVYDADGELVCKASPNATAAGVICPPAGSPRVADTTTTAYDSAGEITSVTDPNGHTTSYAYDADRNQTQVTSPDGHITSYTYDGDNRLTKMTRADGTTVVTAYDANGNVTGQTDAAGNVTTYSYDSLNRVVTTTNPLGGKTSSGYDAAGNRTTLTDPAGRVTTFSYNAANQLTGITYSGGTTPNVSYTYDADGHRASMTDGTGTTSYSYDSDGRTTNITNGAGATVSYGYDPAGNLTALTYPNGNVVSRVYDGAGRLTSVSDWLGNTTSFGYDRNGNLTSEVYPNTVTAASTFDNADQLTSITDRTGPSTLASFGYARDNQSLVTSDSETGTSQGTHTFTYTQLSQLASDNGTAYGYDANGDPTSLANGAAQTFNAGGEVTSAQRSSTPKPPAADQVVSANQTSKGTKITSPAFTTRTANELLLAMISTAGPSTGGQQISAVSGAGLTWTLVTRANGKPGTAEVWQAHTVGPLTNVKITATLAKTGYDGSITVASFTGAREVSGAHAEATGGSTNPSVSVTTTSADSLVWGVGEDATSASSRTPASGQTVVNQYLDTVSHATYWSQKTGVITASGTKVTLGDTVKTTDNWDLAAVEINSASGTKTSYSYDLTGNRTKITPSTGPATTLGYDQAGRLVSYGSTATYAYNGDGLRMSKTVNGSATAFTWDQSGIRALVLAGGNQNYIYGPGNQPIEQINGTTVTYLLADQQGSTRLLTSSTGSVVGTYSYTPFGLPVGHTGTISTALQYDGQYTDAESGFQYLQARYYDRVTTQFVTKDPLSAVTMAPYAFAEANPLNENDPLGLYSCGLSNPFGCVGNAYNALAGAAGNFFSSSNLCKAVTAGLFAAGGLEGSIEAIGDETTRASALLRAGSSKGGQIMSTLSNSDIWQQIGAVGRSDAVAWAGRSLLGAGAVLSFIDAYQQTGNVGVAATDAIGDTAISWGAAEAGAWAGTEIGFAVGGPVGALVGAGVGTVVGAGVSLVASGVFNNAVSDVASWF